MTLARKRGLYVASLIGAIAAGFASHWIVPLAVKDAPAAQAPLSEKRLEAIELKLEVIAQDINMAKTDVRVIKCYLHLEQICPPYPAEGR